MQSSVSPSSLFEFFIRVFRKSIKERECFPQILFNIELSSNKSMAMTLDSFTSEVLLN